MAVAIEEALTTLWAGFVDILPGILAAAITLAIGFITGKVAGRIVKEILVRSSADKYLAKKEHVNYSALKGGAY